MNTKQTLVIFGASGALSREKLFPALLRLNQEGESFSQIIGFARTPLTTRTFIKSLKSAYCGREEKNQFWQKVSYLSGSYSPEGISKLKPFLAKKPVLYYFALPVSPDFIIPLISGLKKEGLLKDKDKLILEKPVGKNLKEAQEIIKFLKATVCLKNVYFIDHYLGKTMVRNIIALRFANPIFKSLWNNQFLEKINIDILEKEGIGRRGQYYDQSGAIRDIVQNHGLQLLSLIGMDEPRSLEEQEFFKKRREVLQKVRLFGGKFAGNVKIGQYQGYQKEPYVAQNSLTETYACLNLEINSPKMAGIPIKITTGKKLARKKTVIEIYFKKDFTCSWQGQCNRLLSNRLTIDIASPAISLQLNTRFKNNQAIPSPEELKIKIGNDQEDPYQQVLSDILANSQFSFPQAEDILSSWRFIDPLLAKINSQRKRILKIY